MKINGLGRIAVGLLAIVFVGNVFSMVMTPKEREKAKVAAQKMMKEIQQQQQTKLEEERKKQFQPGKYFVYEKDTSKGVLIDQKLLEENSEMVKSMVTDFGSKPQEIFLPFPIEIIRAAFASSNRKTLTLNQLVGALNCFDYLLMDNNSDLIDAVVDRINDIGDKIVSANVVPDYAPVFPDYIILGQIQNPSVMKIIINKVLSTPGNFCERFVNYYNRWNGYYGRGPWDQGISVHWAFGNMTSILAILDKVKNFISDVAKHLERVHLEEEENKKWFWQRK